MAHDPAYPPNRVVFYLEIRRGGCGRRVDLPRLPRPQDRLARGAHVQLVTNALESVSRGFGAPIQAPAGFLGGLATPDECEATAVRQLVS